MNLLVRVFPWKILSLFLLASPALYADQILEEDPPKPEEKCPLYNNKIPGRNVLELDDYNPTFNPYADNFEFHSFYERYAAKNPKGEEDCAYPIYQWVLLETNSQCFANTTCVNVYDCRGCFVGAFPQTWVVRINANYYGIKKVAIGYLGELADRIIDTHFYELFSENISRDNIYGAISMADENINQSTEALIGKMSGEFIFSHTNVTLNGVSDWNRITLLNPSITDEWGRQEKARAKLEEGPASLRSEVPVEKKKAPSSGSSSLKIFDK